MNVGTLKAMLDGHDDEVEIMIAHQPSWPLAEVVASVIADSERDVHDDMSDDVDEDGSTEFEDVLWIVAGGHADGRSPYAPRDVFESW